MAHSCPAQAFHSQDPSVNSSSPPPLPSQMLPISFKISFENLVLDLERQQLLPDMFEYSRYLFAG